MKKYTNNWSLGDFFLFTHVKVLYIKLLSNIGLRILLSVLCE